MTRLVHTARAGKGRSQGLKGHVTPSWPGASTSVKGRVLTMLVPRPQEKGAPQDPGGLQSWGCRISEPPQVAGGTGTFGGPQENAFAAVMSRSHVPGTPTVGDAALSPARGTGDTQTRGGVPGALRAEGTCGGTGGWGSFVGLGSTEGWEWVWGGGRWGARSPGQKRAAAASAADTVTLPDGGDGGEGRGAGRLERARPLARLVLSRGRG